MAVVDDYLPVAVTTPGAAIFKAALERATDIGADVLNHHLPRHLVLVDYDLELLLTRVNSLVQLLILRHLLGNHLDLVNLRHHEPVLLLRLLLLLLLVLQDLLQLLLSEFLWLILDLVLLGKILVVYWGTWLLHDHVLLLFRLLLLSNAYIITGHLQLLVLAEVVNLCTISSLVQPTTTWLDHFSSVLSIFD